MGSVFLMAVPSAEGKRSCPWTPTVVSGLGSGETVDILPHEMTRDVCDGMIINCGS